MKINNPLLVNFRQKGKCLLEYKGTNMSFEGEATKLLTTEIFRRNLIKEHPVEKMFLIIKLHCNTEILGSLISSAIYIKEKDNWIKSEDSFITNPSMYFDDEYIFFEGAISYKNEIKEGTFYDERYSFLSTFKSNKLFLTSMQEEFSL